MIDNTPILREALKYNILSKGLSVNSFSKQVDVTYGGIHHILSGRSKRIQEHTLAKLCNALGLEYDDMVALSRRKTTGDQENVESMVQCFRLLSPQRQGQLLKTFTENGFSLERAMAEWADLYGSKEVRDVVKKLIDNTPPSLLPFAFPYFKEKQKVWRPGRKRKKRDQSSPDGQE